MAVKDAPQVPDFTPYQAASPDRNRAVSYFMIGTMGVLTASIAKSSVTGFLETMAASADVLAMAKVEVDLANIPEGKNVIIKWRGKPVFIRHRTADEIEEARQTDWKHLRDPQSDEERTKKPEWLVMLGVCTHLGCVPIGEAGDYGGWLVLSTLFFYMKLIWFSGSALATVLITIFLDVLARALHLYVTLQTFLQHNSLITTTFLAQPRSARPRLQRC